MSSKRKKVFNGWTDARDDQPSGWVYNDAIHIPYIHSRKTDADHPGYKIKITIEWEENH